MTLTDDQADELADLLNSRNELTVRYSRAKIQKSAERYLVHFDSGRVAAFVELVPVQWYQAEVRHLTTAAGYVRKGHARSLLREAEDRARADGARILQCTIRKNNNPSRTLFEAEGYKGVSSFLNTVGGNVVEVFQKVLCPAKEA